MGFTMDEIEREKTQLFRQLIIDAKLDADEIMKALDESVVLGLVNWGTSHDVITKLLTDPQPEDIHSFILNSQDVLKPLEDWMIIERNVNDLRKDMISKLDYYHTEYRCSQIQNFILILKLY